ncbi:hypothetical protein VLK31_09385 [Variovorax sp. H27-G14]|uniref:hypothetical protein n=1 Tax=Variovorax sp. H27-G14 TaxID=3111914 RepID=UPI0038FCA77A
MQWIDEKGLAIWAARTDARALLIDMVADLIRATISDASRFRFPGGDVGQLRGWDGDLETAEAVGLVPAGKSKWEFGSGAGAAKASADYKKRTGSTGAEVMAENALVLVNLDFWDTPRSKLTEWEDERKAEGKWKNVKYVDAVSLVHWLDQNPAVAARYARDVLRSAPQEGALSTDEFWEEFSLQFKPRVTEKLVIGDRQEFATELVDTLKGPAQSILIGAETSEEVIAFAVAAIRNSETEQRRALESKTLIVRTESAARFLSTRSGLIFLAANGAEPLAGVLAERGATLSAATGAQARKHKLLQRPTATGMAEGFMSMGLERDAGYELAQRCGRSLTILKRLIPTGPVPQPEWFQHAVALKPAFLAGGWSSNVQLDREILKVLGGFQDYAHLESVLMTTIAMSDRPIDKVADVWQVRAPVDAFHFYGQQITDTDLERLRAAILKVFTHAPTQPSRDQQFSLSYVPPADYSKWLRDGLALTLVIIAAMHSLANLHVNGGTAQQYVDEIVTALPDWGKSHQSLSRLGDQTVLFAEAAPNPFLTALESMLEGDRGEIKTFFVSKDDGFFKRSSPHVELLWALEVLAWDPKHLNRTVLALAKLAEIDPDPESNLSNRPINSLRSILLSWSPNTYAPLAQRLACLESIIKVSRTIGWQLLMKLLPRIHDSSSPTQRPRLRDVEPKNPEILTFGLVWDFQAAVVKRALTMAADNEERIIALVKAMSAFQSNSRSAVLEYVDQYLASHQTPDGSKVWHELRNESSRHEFFSDADWAIQQEEREFIASIIDRHRPADPIVEDRQVFDDWLPHIGKYLPDSAPSEDPDQLRAAVLQRVLDRDGVHGILRLAKMVRLPNLIGPALRNTSISSEQLFELLASALDPSAPRDLAYFVSAVGADKFGNQWKEIFEQRALQAVHDPAIKAQLLLGWPLDETTWSFVESLGEEVRGEYWRQISALPIRGTVEQLIFAIGQLRQQGRDLEALGLAHLRLKDLPTDLIESLLTIGIKQAPTAVSRMGNMLSYYVSSALAEMRKRDDANELAIAKLEYAYLPALHYEKEPLTIIGMMAKDPTLFIEVLSHVFKGKNSIEKDEVSLEEKAKASTSYDLLSAFKMVPGLDNGRISSTLLFTWVTKARELAKEKDLTQVADIYIGHVLAHAPIDPDEFFWPPSAICMVIEELASNDIEHGISTECFNKRGVYGKAINEGGAQERKLSNQYQDWAGSTNQFPRTSTLLTAIADMWRQQADGEDTRAEKDKLKM